MKFFVRNSWKERMNYIGLPMFMNTMMLLVVLFVIGFCKVWKIDYNFLSLFIIVYGFRICDHVIGIYKYHDYVEFMNNNTKSSYTEGERSFSLILIKRVTDRLSDIYEEHMNIYVYIVEFLFLTMYFYVFMNGQSNQVISLFYAIELFCLIKSVMLKRGIYF